MIKINLLPKTINEKRAVRNTAILFGVILVALLAAGFTYSMKLSADVAAKEEEATQIEALKAEVEGIQAQAAGVRNATKPIQQKLDFIKAVLKYNEEFCKLYANVARWTYEKVTYTSMQCDGAQLQMQARVKSLDDLGRYLLNMYRATDLFTTVTISGLPGYPQGSTPGGQNQPYGAPMMEGMDEMGGSSLAGIGAITQGVQRAPEKGDIDFTVTCILRTPIVAPQFAGAGTGAPGQPGMPGQPGATPMSPGGPYTPTPGPGGPQGSPM